MKKINNYWTDENNNKWNIKIYTKDQALKFSKTLINCKNCIDCNSCNSCDSCNSCNSCNSCDSCKSCNSCGSCDSCNYCDSCKSCNSCDSCKSCNSCDSCDSCKYCNSCYSCGSCDSCKYCKNYKSNPQRFFSKNIGSRKSQTEIYWTCEINIHINCGCFHGNLEEFKKRIENTHKKGTDYREQYDELIETIKYLIKK